jgi:DNA-binding NarL/FixJ family response regulator
MCRKGRFNAAGRAAPDSLLRKCAGRRRGNCCLRRVRILLGDDHVLVLNGIKALLEPHYDVVAAVPDGRQLVDSALRLKPDLVILDISMPQLNGLEAAKQIKNSLPSAKLIFLSMHANAMYLRKTFAAGASAYVLKSGVIDELLKAIRQVLDGNTYVSPGCGPNALDGLRGRSGKPSREEDELTGRQLEVLQLIVEGKPSKEIAYLLGISIKTVDFHRGRIMERLGAHTVAEIVRIAVEQGFIPASTTGSL